MKFGDVLNNLNVPHRKLTADSNGLRYLIRKVVSEIEID